MLIVKVIFVVIINWAEIVNIVSVLVDIVLNNVV